MTALPVAVHTGTLTLGTVTLRVARLDDGRAILDADDVAALFASWEEGGTVDQADAERLAAFMAGNDAP